MFRACYFDISGNVSLPEQMLPTSLLAHIAKYSAPLSLQRSRAAWTLLYWLEPVCPVFSASGQPTLPGQELFVSVSHSKNIVAAAVSDAPVGIDVECITNRNITNLAEKCLSNDEYLRFCAAEDKRLCFYQHWTAKEAYAKLTGDGLHGFPTHIQWHDDGTVGTLRQHVSHQILTDSGAMTYCLCVAGKFAAPVQAFQDLQ